MKHMFIVYDERATIVDGTCDASVFVCEDTQRQAERWSERGYVWRYDIQPKSGTEKRTQLVNETFIGPTRVLADALEAEQARRMK